MERHVPEPTHTLEGWHVLHDFRLLDFARWFSAPLEAREDAWEELKGLVREWRELEEAGQGSYGIYQVVGHKADLLFLNLRPGLDPFWRRRPAFPAPPSPGTWGGATASTPWWSWEARRSP